MALIGKILATYKTNLLISLLLAGALVLLAPQKDILTITGIIFGSFIGTFILDIEYFTYAFVTNPKEEFSNALRLLVEHKNYIGVISYIKANRQSLEGSMTRSAVLQVFLFALSIYVIMTLERGFSLAFVLSAFIQSVYEMYEDVSEKGSAASWFWVLKEKPSKKAQNIYLYSLCGCVVFILVLLS